MLFRPVPSLLHASIDTMKSFGGDIMICVSASHHREQRDEDKGVLVFSYGYGCISYA